MQKKQKPLEKMTASEQVAYISKAMGHHTLAKPPRYWLRTGSKRLNTVLGSPKLGIAYGKMITLAGPPSSAKSALAAMLCGLAQKDGAKVGWADAENSYDHVHVAKQGLDSGEPVTDKDGTIIGYTKVALFKPEYGVFAVKKKKKKGKAVLFAERVESAEEYCERVENWMKLQRRINPKGKLILVLDSTTAISPEEEMMGGFTGQNMRTRSSNAVLLNLMTKRWVALAEHVNAIIILIAQLRQNPGAMFEDPNYVTGGNGILYYPSIVAWVRRVKGGEIKQEGRQIGVQGVITNKKNKAGGGSIERKKCGYKAYFYQNKWSFMDASEMKKEI